MGNGIGDNVNPMCCRRSSV